MVRRYRGASFPAVAVAFGYILVAAPARALPKYAQAEKKPCSYCHVKPSGGGARTAAGNWYKTHGLSLKGYTPPKAAGKAAPKKPTQNNKSKKK